MAHVEKRGPSRWRARYRDPYGLERSKTFTRRIDAERWLTSVEHAKLSGAYVDPAAGRVTFEDWAMQWLDAPGKRPSAWARDEAIVRVHLLATLGGRALGTINPGDVQALVTTCGRPDRRPGLCDASTTCCGPSSTRPWPPSSSPAPPVAASGCRRCPRPPATS